MKGTKLWKRAGSPLIHGRIRRQRPVYATALVGFALAVPSAACAFYLYRAPAAGNRISLLVSEAEPVLIGAVVGALLGGWLATRFGSLRAWVYSAAIGAVAAFAAAVVYVAR